MSLTLDEVKKNLRVGHDDLDDTIQRMIDSAEAECLNFIDQVELPSEIPFDMKTGIILMIQADFYGDPAKRLDHRRAAESLWMPYREQLGV